MYKSIVVGTDGSATARQAVEQAAGLARQSGAKLHLVSAYKPPSQALSLPMGEGLIAATATSDRDVQQSVEAMLEKLAADIGGDGLEITTYACPENPADALLDVAAHQSADLIVVGSRGMTGARRILGSVPNSVAHHAACSVLIVNTA